MNMLHDPEEKITCPYNSAHLIRRCRMAVHIAKCKKSFPDQKMMTCDFNSCHMIPEAELQYHHSNCPDRKKIEGQIITQSSSTKCAIPNFEPMGDENWDDLDCPSYNPQEVVQTRNVLRHLDVESAAKRRNFRMAERQRLSELNDARQPAPSTSTSETLPFPERNRQTNPRANPSSQKTSLKEKLKTGHNKVFQQ